MEGSRIASGGLLQARPFGKKKKKKKGTYGIGKKGFVQPPWDADFKGSGDSVRDHCSSSAGFRAATVNISEIRVGLLEDL